MQYVLPGLSGIAVATGTYKQLSQLQTNDSKKCNVGVTNDVMRCSLPGLSDLRLQLGRVNNSVSYCDMLY